MGDMHEFGYKNDNGNWEAKDGYYSDKLANGTVQVGKWGCQWSSKYEDQLLSIRMADSISGTAMVLVVTIMLSVVIIVSASTLTSTRHKEEPGKLSREFSVPEEAMEAWWVLMRFVMLVTMVMMLYGALLSINVMNDVSYMKYPQPWLRTRCEEAGWTLVENTGMVVDGEYVEELYEGGRILQYWASYSIGRVGKLKGTDPLYQYGIGYIWGTCITGVAVVMAGYAQYMAYNSAEILKERNEDAVKVGDAIGDATAAAESAEEATGDASTFTGAATFDAV